MTTTVQEDVVWLNVTGRLSVLLMYDKCLLNRACGVAVLSKQRQHRHLWTGKRIESQWPRKGEMVSRVDSECVAYRWI